MRIIAGLAKGRRLAAPQGLVTRPPTDRMREAVFSSLGGAVVEASVLDLYAGTGAFGLEAMSRGAAAVTFVERDKDALGALRSNIDAVGLGGSVIADDVGRALRRDRGLYSLVFVDPPYAVATVEVEEVLGLLEVVTPHGAIALVHRRRDHEESGTTGTLTLTARRRYGDSEIWWYAKEAQ